MVYTTNIPQATDLISNSQAQILGNFQFLGATAGNLANGYYRFPNGLIMQWGVVVNAPDDTAVAFNVAFVTACHNVQLTVVKNSGTAEDFAYVKSTATVTTAQFVPRVVGNNLPYDLYWFAIGV